MAKVTEARIYGFPVEALCGERFVPAAGPEEAAAVRHLQGDLRPLPPDGRRRALGDARLLTRLSRSSARSSSPFSSLPARDPSAQRAGRGLGRGRRRRGRGGHRGRRSPRSRAPSPVAAPPGRRSLRRWPAARASRAAPPTTASTRRRAHSVADERPRRPWLGVLQWTPAPARPAARQYGVAASSSWVGASAADAVGSRRRDQCRRTRFGRLVGASAEAVTLASRRRSTSAADGRSVGRSVGHGAEEVPPGPGDAVAMSGERARRATATSCTVPSKARRARSAARGARGPSAYTSAAPVTS